MSKGVVCVSVERGHGLIKFHRLGICLLYVMYVCEWITKEMDCVHTFLSLHVYFSIHVSAYYLGNIMCVKQRFSIHISVRSVRAL